jgi:uncharacterized protein (DUF433 family)
MDKKLFDFKEADQVKRVPKKTMDWRPHISIDPHVMRGRACVAETRIPVSIVLHYLALGMSKDELLAEFPILTQDSIAAVLAYAAELTGEPVNAIP